MVPAPLPSQHQNNEYSKEEISFKWFYLSYLFIFSTLLQIKIVFRASSVSKWKKYKQMKIEN
jgi:heme/copper-type cytochrome/quinol oxidase subunit 3